MNRAACVIRSSQGDDAKASLEYQREVVPDLARDLVGEGGDIDIIDLGIHSGWSKYSYSPEEYERELLHQNSEIRQLIAEMSSGKYDILVAQDSERIARDQFFDDIRIAARDGEVEIVFSDELYEDIDSLPAEIIRVVERYQKQKEIKKSKIAKRRRRQRGYPDGPPPFALQYNSEKTAFEPDESDFERVRRAFRLHSNGDSYRSIAEEVGIPKSTVHRILNQHRTLYERHIEEERGEVLDA